MNLFDKILIISLVIVAFSFNGVFSKYFDKGVVANTLVVKVDNEVYATYDIKDEGTYRVETEDGHYNIFTIKDGYVDVIDADCPDKLDVYQRKISKNGETIVCLPNKVVFEMQNDIESELDSIAQ